MKKIFRWSKWFEAGLLIALGGQAAELFLRRLVWHQNPPEVPLFLWGAILLADGIALAWLGICFFRLRGPL